MCSTIRLMTLGLLPLPALLAVGLAQTPLPLLAIAVPGFVALLYLSVSLWWRPTRFDLDDSGLVIRWPARRQQIPWREIRAARALDRRALRRELGIAARIGAGGLWGGFGWLWSSRRGLLDLYVSRTDRILLIERQPGRALLITPERPEEFSRAVRERAASAPA